MKAIVLHGFGGTDQFREERLAVPQPRPHEVRVRILAASFNPIDAYWRAGRISRQLPVVLGRDFSGIVDAVGSEVGDLKVGDAVYGLHGGHASNGAYAEYLCVPALLVARQPRTLSAEAAAGLPVVAMTAYKCVMAKARVASGQAAFVAGGAGGVGSMIVQLLRLAGASPIVATAGSARSAAALTDELGIEPRHVLRYQGLALDELVQAALACNDGRQYGATFDTVGANMKRLCFELAEADGHVVSIVEEPADYSLNLWDEHESPMVAKSLSFHFEQLSARAAGGDPAKLALYRQELEWLAERIDAGELRAPNHRVVGGLTLETVAEAHAALEAGTGGAKLVMRVGE